MSIKNLLLCSVFVLHADSVAAENTSETRAASADEIEMAECVKVPSLPRVLSPDVFPIEFLYCSSQTITPKSCDQVESFLTTAQSLYTQLDARDPDAVKDHLQEMIDSYERFCPEREPA